MIITINAVSLCGCVMYQIINASSFFLSVFDTFAYPYPGKSTKYIFSISGVATSKKLISRVFPGVRPVLTNLVRSRSAFMVLDFPTLDRPIKAI